MIDASSDILKIRESLPYYTKLVLGFFCVVIVLIIWLILSSGENRISPLILPSPGEVISAFGPLHWEMELTTSVYLSIKRVTLGFMIAAALAIPLGIMMGAFPKVCAFFDPLALVGGYIPVVTLIPLTLAWWGLCEKQKVGFLVIGVFVFLLPMVVKTVQSA